VQPIVDGWIARLSLTVPLIGWLILFNDKTGGALEFKSLGITESESLFSADVRLRLVYFGLISLGSANIIFRTFAPREILQYKNIDIYIRTAMELFTHGQLLDICERRMLFVRDGIHGPDLSGKGLEFKSSADAVFQNIGHDNRDGKLEYETVRDRYSPYLRSMVRIDFVMLDQSRVAPMLLALLLAVGGYILLLLPSIDVFYQVVRSTF